MIMHIDMDAFFASIEQQVNPSLRGKPLIITGRQDKYRSVVCAASYEAKALGIDSGMPSWQALRLCPFLKSVPADSGKYIYTSNRILSLLESLDVCIKPASVDEFYIDCRFGRIKDPEKLAKEIKALIKAQLGITCSVGIAPSLVSSKIAAKLVKPDGLLMLDRVGFTLAISALAVEKIPGIGNQTKKKLNLLGIFTCSQLESCSQQFLLKRFGKLGVWLFQAVRAYDELPAGFWQKEKPKSVSHSQTLKHTTSDFDTIRSWIYLLSEMVASRLRKKGLVARTICLGLAPEYAGSWQSGRKTLSIATDDGQQIFLTAFSLFEAFCCLNVRTLSVTVQGLLEKSYDPFFQDEKKRSDLTGSVDLINSRFGEWAVFPAVFKQAVF